MPDLVDDMRDGGPAAYCGCCGTPQKTNPTCYFGAGRQATPMHFDPAENLLCVVEGSKHLTLYHPAETKHLYPCGERNTSVVYSHVDMTNPPDLSRYADLARATPHAVTVERGDVLYLPCGWWHAVQGSRGRNLSINYWFALRESKRDVRLALKAMGIDDELCERIGPGKLLGLKQQIEQAASVAATDVIAS